MIVVVGRSSTLLRIHKNHDKSSSKGGGTRYSTSYQNTPHAQYSMRYDEEIVHTALRRQQQLISSSALLVLFTVCTDVGSRTVVYHWWQNLALFLPQDCKKTLHIDYSCASDAVISIGRHNCSCAHTTVQQREIKHRVSANSTTGVEAHTQSDYISAHHKSHTHSKQY